MGFFFENYIAFLRGRVKIPIGGYSPRAFEQDSVEFRNRQYSLDERRMRRKSVQTYAYLSTHETEIPLVKRGFLFFYAQEIVRSTLTFIYPIRQL